MIIRGLGSDLESSRPVRFKPGANVILCERRAAEGGAGGGRGGSPLLAILDYCLGGQRTGPLRDPRLGGRTFLLDAEHGGRPFTVGRSVDSPGMVWVKPAAGLWPKGGAPAAEPLSGAAPIGVDKYRRTLGRIMFGLDPGADPKGNGRRPTFRSLAPYVMRRGGGRGAYASPFSSRRMQPASDVQVNNAYLLGLDWELAAERADAIDYGTRLAALKREATGGILAGVIGSAGELEAALAALEEASKGEEDAIRSFSVHERYAKLEEEADGLTGAMHELVNARSVKARMLEGYRRSTEREPKPPAGSVLAIYEEAGVLFPGSVRRRLDEARRFHESIVEGRRELLGPEMGRLEAEVREKGLRIGELGRKRAEIMGVLEAHGAVEELVEMQARHQQTAEKKADASARLEALGEIGRKGAALGERMARLRERAESGYEASESQRRKAMLAFDRCSRMVFGAPGRLSIGVAEGGYKLGAKIGGGNAGGARGAAKMKVLCYDLALASLWAGRPESPGLLAHDSEMFDGAGGRQAARALQAAAEESGRLGVQYICAIGSDAVPYGEFDGGFDFDSRVVARIADGEGPLGTWP